MVEMEPNIGPKMDVQYITSLLNFDALYKF